VAASFASGSPDPEGAPVPSARLGAVLPDSAPDCAPLSERTPVFPEEFAGCSAHSGGHFLKPVVPKTYDGLNFFAGATGGKLLPELLPGAGVSATASAHLAHSSSATSSASRAT